MSNPGCSGEQNEREGLRFAGPVIKTVTAHFSIGSQPRATRWLSIARGFIKVINDANNEKQRTHRWNSIIHFARHFPRSIRNEISNCLPDIARQIPLNRAFRHLPRRSTLVLARLSFYAPKCPVSCDVNATRAYQPYRCRLPRLAK